MATKLKPVGHDERLSLVEHLDELRTRIIICVATFAIAFAVCLWQDNFILNLINRPLAETATGSCETTKDPLEQSNCWQQTMRRVNADLAALAQAAALQASTEPRLAVLAQRLSRSAAVAQAATPRSSPKRPVTLGVGEPFTATVRVAAYAALLVSLPVLLYQLYAFLLPAFSPREREVALPLMLMVPFLFIAGVAFGYLLVLPAAVRFLQHFNDDQYDILIQARDYYKFAVMILGVMGLLFQMPIAIIGVTRVGIVSTRTLRANRRYAILIIAVIAMVLPGQDPVTMLSMMLPMIVLFEVSILWASLLDRRKERALVRAGAVSDDTDADGDPQS
jgi:sec-independent protein translocase protein TatC